MRYLASLLFMALLSLPAHAGDSAQGHPCATEGIAIGGYDLVSYHIEGGPVAGSKDYAHTHGTLTYLFSSNANRTTFVADPERYLPVYQGWCAATLAMGRLVCPDYTNFKIEDGRLLLFEVTGFTNGRTLWDSDPFGFRQRADANFKSLVK